MKVIALVGALVFLALLPSYATYDESAAALTPIEQKTALSNPAETANPDIPRPQTLLSKAEKSASGAENPRYSQKSDIKITKSGAWDKIDFSSRKLTNNRWGAPPGEDITSSIYLSRDERFGWYWCRKNPQKTGLVTQPIYPNIRIGGSPWEKSNSVYFPVKLGDIESLEVETDYSYLENVDGSFNLSYDMFLLDTDKAGPEPEIKAEVMIWLHGTKKQLAVTYKGDFSDGYNEYELYSWKMLDGRLYYSFVMKGEPVFKARHKVNAGALIDKLGLDSDLYVHGVELGTEVWEGSGKIEIEKFTVNLNGQGL